MWILLKDRLPVRPSPPAYSIHWADSYLVDVEGLEFFGRDTKEDGAVWIIFDSEPIKVWPHEYDVISEENFWLYVLGDDNLDGLTMSHVPMYGINALWMDPVSCTAIQDGFEQHPRFDKQIYEAAIIDGASDPQAFLAAFDGVPLDIWFAINAPYGAYFNLYEIDLLPLLAENRNTVLDEIKSGWAE